LVYTRSLENRMKQNFDRKIYTACLLFSDLGFLIWNTPKIIGISGEKKISKAFMEKIMNVTTAVNGCTYCAWFHAKQALTIGISEEEIQNMMNLQFQADAEEFELMALLYAQHYAETNRNPDAEIKQKLMDYYGDKMANDVILVIRMIFLGNLYGNTWDAVLSRIKGMPAKGSNILFELIFFLINFWFMFPLMWLMKRNQ
jgi:AhpD family alkylhydroperoxidase